MPYYQVKCDTVLVVEADSESHAVDKFIYSLNEGGFSYTSTFISPLIEAEGTRD